MNYYEKWDVFIANIDDIPDQLDGDKLIKMVSKLSYTREERELLGKMAAKGDKISLKKFVDSYIPMIVGIMKRYALRGGYNKKVLMSCVKNVEEKVTNTVYLDNLEYNTRHYVDWMTQNEVTHYIKTMQSTSKEFHIKMNEVSEHKSMQELVEMISTFILDKNQSEEIEKLLSACGNDRERELLSFRFGLEDGIPKTIQETADEFEISRERIKQIENIAMRRIMVYIRRRRTKVDSLNDGS